MKKKRILLALLALALAVSVSLPAAMAYFTTNARANGTRTLQLGGSTTIEENMAEWVKEITVSAKEDSQPMWVRVSAIPYGDLALDYIPGDGWISGGDGWYYYTTPLANPADGSSAVLKTTLLQIRVDHIKVDEVGMIPEDFDVPVVCESAPVLYSEEGGRLAYNDPMVWTAEITTD